MSDLREAVADRLERAADRMSNSGFLDEERRYRDAAARIRAGLSVEETQALERRMLTDPQPGLLHRLSALAAQGEYDAPGPESLEEALTEPVLTDIESGANQLLSTAFPNGVSDPFSPAQGGWVFGPLVTDPFANIATGGGSVYSFAGQNVDFFTGLAPEGVNANSFTTGQNVDPLTGVPNAESFSGGPVSSQSPPPSIDNNYGFGSAYSGQNTSILNNPGLLAANDVPANPNIASDAVPDYASDDSDEGSAKIVTINGVNYVFDASSSTGAHTFDPGNTVQESSAFIFFPDDPDTKAYSLAPQATQPPVAPVAAPPPTPPPDPPVAAPPTASPDQTPATPAPQAPPQAAPSAPPPSPLPAPPDPTQTQQTDSPPPAPPGPTQTQQTASPPPAPQPGSPTVPFDPQAGNPFTKWLLYGNDTPILDFLTNDSNLQVAQNVALGVSATAATIATGGLLLDAAPGILGTIGSGGATSILGAGATSAPTLTALGTGAAGILATHPELPGELEEGLEGALPSLEGALPSLEEEAAEEGTALHHIFPQEFREQFEELGIDIDKYAIRLDAQTEHIPLHVGVNTEEWAGGYNDHWAVFLEQEGITAKDAVEFATEFLNDLGLAGPEYPIVPFK